jgi:hypothetical protein
MLERKAFLKESVQLTNSRYTGFMEPLAGQFGYSDGFAVIRPLERGDRPAGRRDDGFSDGPFFCCSEENALWFYFLRYSTCATIRETLEQT